MALPHAWAGEQALTLHDFVTTDFTADPGQATTTTTAATTTSAPPSTTSGHGQHRPATTTTTTAPPTTTTTLPPGTWGEDGRITIALLGGDAGPGRGGIRTDTNIVVSIDPATWHTVMFSIPRNQIDWPVPAGIPAYDHWADHLYPEIVNTIYQYGLDRPELFPGGPNTGGNAVKAILGEGLGLEIDYFALVDLLGFVGLVDALGGIDIYVTKPVNDPKQVWPNGAIVDVVVDEGFHHFDGLWALAYARVRQQDNDYYRMDRQRCVLEAAAAQADPFTMLMDFSDPAPHRAGEPGHRHPGGPVPRLHRDAGHGGHRPTSPRCASCLRRPNWPGPATPTSRGTDSLGYWYPRPGVHAGHGPIAAGRQPRAGGRRRPAVAGRGVPGGVGRRPQAGVDHPRRQLPALECPVEVVGRLHQQAAQHGADVAPGQDLVDHHPGRSARCGARGRSCGSRPGSPRPPTR